MDFIPPALGEEGVGDEENTPFNGEAMTPGSEGDEATEHKDNGDDKDFDP